MIMESYFIELTDVGKSRVSKEEIDCSDLKENEAIIKTEYSMISAGTELSRAFALKKGFSYPVRPGYCMVGKILEKGEAIRADVGDLVFFNAPHASLVRWNTSDKVQSRQILKLKEGIDPVEASAINLMLVAMQGVNLSNVKLGYTVGVFGLGNIGILTALMYQKLGCKVIGFDVVKGRCELAKSMGLKYTASENYEEIIKKVSEGKDLDIAVDVTGLSQVIADCISYTRRYGQVILLGSPRQSYESDLMPVFSKIHMKNLKVLGGFNQTIPVYETDGSYDCLERNFNISCDLIINKDIDISKLITKVIDPKDCEQAYYDLMYHKEDNNCIVFDWRNY